MKKTFASLLVLTLIGGVTYAQVKQQPQPGKLKYTDISTGQPLSLRYNTKDKTMYNSATNQPVDFFINGTGDTISSRGFYVVNNYLNRGADNTYSLDSTRVKMNGTKYWGIKSNKELDIDKNAKLYRQPADSLQ
ncbi:MAG: hypothetical protein QM802_20855 [Agriterribacter sp.]